MFRDAFSGLPNPDAELGAEVARLVEAVPSEQRAAIQQIANVTGDRNVTTEIAGGGN